jgi:hypothetical protein
MKRKNVQMLILIGVVIAGVASILGSGGGGGGGTEYVVTPSATSAASQTCMVCHARNVAPVYLSGGVPIASAPTIVSEYLLSNHYNNDSATCGACHKPAAGHPTPTTAIVNPDANGVCMDCHAGQGLPHINPAIVNVAGSFVGDAASGQYIDPALTTNNCRACHNPHDTTSRMAIFRDYSQRSGHGDINGPAWIHYRWKGSDRAACQRCHTTSSFINYVNGGTGILTYDAADNTKQTLYCIGCHNDYSYTVRPAPRVVANYSSTYNNPNRVGGVTIYTAPYAGTFGGPTDPNPLIDPVTGLATAVNTFPNIGKSNLCMNCHSARAIGDNIRQLGAAIALDPNPPTPAPAPNKPGFGNVGFINSHYLTGGATVYGVSGYEFTGRVYTNRGSFAHNKVGTSLEPATGTGGPCVGCHMTPTNHTFKGWTKDPATARITSVTSLVCTACHGDMTPDAMNEQIELFEAAMAALRAQLDSKGFYWSGNNPYFFTAPYVVGGVNTSATNWLSPGDTNVTGAVTGQNNMGAAFNLNLLLHDPGAYTHNRYYAKRLIYDSIDWLIDGTLPAPASPDVRVTAAITALATAGRITVAQRDLAIAYVLRSGARP